jgi:hypothetical protein
MHPDTVGFIASDRGSVVVGIVELARASGALLVIQIFCRRITYREVVRGRVPW